ncbi:MAG: GntR family transcriptional regulator [Pseudomonadota bacterium]
MKVRPNLKLHEGGVATRAANDERDYGTAECQTISDQAYDLILDKILRLELAPGKLFMEKTLPEALGLGRTPVREALLRLVGEGLLCRRAHRGFFVCEPTAELLLDTYDFKISIECRIAKLAAIRRSDQQADTLNRLTIELFKLDPSLPFEAFVPIGRKFFTTMVEATGNSQYRQIVPRLYNTSIWLLSHAGHVSGDWPRLAADFRALMSELSDAIGRNRGTYAEASIHRYIAKTQDDLIDPSRQLWVGGAATSQCTKSWSPTTRRRNGQFIVDDGSDIWPQDVEAALLAHDAVERAGVVGVRDQVRGEIVWAYITLSAGQRAPAQKELVRFARERVGYKAPEVIKVLLEMPLNATGKVNRVTLEKWAAKEWAAKLRHTRS